MVEQLSEEEVAALLSEAGRFVESDGRQCLRSPIASRACPKTGDVCSSVCSTRRRIGRRSRPGAQLPARFRRRSCRPRRCPAGSLRAEFHVGRSQGQLQTVLRRGQQPVGFVRLRAVLVLSELRLSAQPESADVRQIQLPDHFREQELRTAGARADRRLRSQGPAGSRCGVREGRHGLRHQAVLRAAERPGPRLVAQRDCLLPRAATATTTSVSTRATRKSCRSTGSCSTS